MKMMQRLFAFCAVVMFSLLFFGCDGNDKSSASSGSSKSDVDKSVGSATLILENGERIDYRAALNTGSSLPVAGFGVGLSDHKITLIAQYGNKESLAPGENFDGYITVQGISKAGKEMLGNEKYNSHFNEDAQTGKVGSSDLRIESVDDDKISGTFSGTLYSPSGKKMTIENGRFTTRIKKQKNNGDRRLAANKLSRRNNPAHQLA